MPEYCPEAVSIRPARLFPSSEIAVIAPAGPFDEELLQRGINIWRERGFEVYTRPELAQRQGYLAGSDATRAEIFNAALADPRIKAVVCARGGYGALRIIDRIKFELLATHPKILIGFSDFTVVSMEIWRRIKMVTFSGPMMAGGQLGRLSASQLDEYFSTLTSDVPPPPLSGEYARTLIPGRAEGILLGGNLTLLCYLAVAQRLPSMQGAVLMMEDTHEAPYRIDRMLTALKLGGHLDRLAGLAIGRFGPGIDDRELDHLLLDRLEDLRIPILAGLDVGHEGFNRLVPVGLPVILDTDKKSVTFTCGGVC